MTMFFFESYRSQNPSETLQIMLRWYLKLFRFFRAKKEFFINFSFFEFFHIAGVMDFLKND